MLAKRTAILLLAVVLVVPALGDSKHAEGKSEETSKTHAPAEAGFMPWAYTNIDKWFAIPQETAEAHFKERLPKGIADVAETAKPKNEKEIASVVADLFGTVNDKQAKQMIEWAIQAKKKIEETSEKDLTSEQKQKLLLLQRLLWAAKILRGGAEGFEALKDVKDTAPQFKPFEAAFNPQWERVKEKNRRYHTALEEATGANEEKRAKAAALLREGFDGVPSFIKGQADSENDDLVAKIADSTAGKLSDGTRFMDFADAKGKPVRILLGSDRKNFAKALREGLAHTALPEGGAKKLKLAPKLFEKVEQPIHPAVLKPIAVADGKEPKKDIKTQAHEFLGKNCATCHDPDNGHAFKVTKQGTITSTHTPEDLNRMLHGNGVSKTGQMKDVIAGLDAKDIKLMEEWANQAKAEKGDTKKTEGTSSPKKSSVKETVNETGDEDFPSDLEEAKSRNYITDSRIFPARDFATQLKAAFEKGEKPTIWNIGPRHGEKDPKIPGSEFVADVFEENGIDKLKQKLAGRDKNEAITLYCGCCPSDTCQPLMQALHVLHQQGFTNARIVSFEKSIDEWTDIAKAAGLASK